MYLGVRLGTSEIFVGEKDGVSRASSFKRLPVVQRYNVETFNEFQGVPWKIKPHQKASTDHEGEVDIELDTEIDETTAMSKELVEKMMETTRLIGMPR